MDLNPAVGARRYRRRVAPRWRLYALVFAAAIGTASIGIPVIMQDLYRGAGAILALAVIAVGSAPMFLMLWRGRPTPLPLLELNGLYYVVAFGVPGLLQKGNQWSVSRGSVNECLVLTLLGLIALDAGYYLLGRRAFRQLKPIHMPAVRPGVRLVLLGLCFEALFLVKVAANVHFPSIDQLVPLLGGAGKVLILYEMLLPRDFGGSGRVLALVLGGPLLLADAVLGLASGSLWQAFPIVILVALCWVRFRRRIPVVIILGSALLFSFLNSGKAEYRQTYWAQEQVSSSPVERVRDLFRFSAASSSNPTDALETTVFRLDALTLFAAVREQTPGSIPYALGSTLEPAFYVWIPRILWPGKPLAELGNSWAHRYGLLSPDDTVTSLNLPWLVEFYINFGSFGVILGMLFVGVLYSFLLRLLISRTNDVLAFAIALGVLSQRWYAESNFVLMWGSVAQGILALVVLLRLLAPRPYRRRPTKGRLRSGHPARRVGLTQ